MRKLRLRELRGLLKVTQVERGRSRVGTRCCLVPEPLFCTLSLHLARVTSTVSLPSRCPLTLTSLFTSSLLMLLHLSAECPLRGDRLAALYSPQGIRTATRGCWVDFTSFCQLQDTLEEPRAPASSPIPAGSGSSGTICIHYLPFPVPSLIHPLFPFQS